MLQRIAGMIAVGLVGFLAACGSSEVQLQQEYTGLAVAAETPGAPVALVLEFSDPSGLAYKDTSVGVAQYRNLATSALEQSGYRVDPSADMVVTVQVRGLNEDGLLQSGPETGRNIALGVISLGMACSKWTHLVSGEGTVTIDRPEREPVRLRKNVEGSAESCEHTVNPSWLLNHQEAGLRTLESAMEQHIEFWLQELGDSQA
ncbi:MAG: hypothetical protein AAGC79_06170 [Pseudomonadota bacterium]